MANDPAFLFYPGDYLRDTQCLSEKAQVAYDRIMCEHMRNICITQQQLNFFTKRLNPDEKEEIEIILTKTDGGFQILWVAESIAQRRLYSESRRKNKLGKGKDMSKSYDKHMENEDENENINKEKTDNEYLWTNIKNSFFNDFRWIEKFCRDKILTQNILDTLMQEFLNDIELKEDYKELKELKSHFTNWFNLKNKTNGTGNNQGGTKLSPSAGRAIANRDY